VPNHTLRRMVEVLAPADRGQPPAERACSTVLTHDDAAGGIVPALRRARSSLKRPSSEAHVPGAPAVSCACVAQVVRCLTDDQPCGVGLQPLAACRRHCCRRRAVTCSALCLGLMCTVRCTVLYADGCGVVQETVAMRTALTEC